MTPDAKCFAANNTVRYRFGKYHKLEKFLWIIRTILIGEYTKVS